MPLYYFKGNEMQKIKIVEAGYDKFTGEFGQIEFIDGVSAYPVSERDAARLGAFVRIEKEDGEQAGDNVKHVAGYDLQVEPEQVLRNAAEPKAQVEGDTTPEGTEAAVAPENGVAAAVVEPKKYTREELGAIADEHGLEGLREIGNQFGVKAVSIAKLIDLIVEKQQ